MKGSTCPSCKLNPLTSKYMDFLKGRALTCARCSTVCELHPTKAQLVHIFYLPALLVVAPALGHSWLAAILAFIVLMLGNVSLLLLLVPLVPYGENAMSAPEANPMSWQQSPLLWVGVPVLVFMAYGVYKLGI